LFGWMWVECLICVLSRQLSWVSLTLFEEALSNGQGCQSGKSPTQESRPRRMTTSAPCAPSLSRCQDQPCACRHSRHLSILRSQFPP
jgi:hypothetical protein